MTADAVVQTTSGKPGSLWVYTPPQGGAAGTGREALTSSPGELRCFDTESAAELFRAEVGELPFTQVVGDQSQATALLAAPGAGVVMVDFNTSPPAPRWVLLWRTAGI